MTRLTWETPVNPRYEIGVDRVVIYQEPTYFGSAWSGVISITEGLQGGERSDGYFDGLKVNDFVTSRNFQGTLRSYTYPYWLSNILGYRSIKTGVLLTRQKRSTFRMTYRTKIGDVGHKIHLVWGCTLVPKVRSYNTIADAPDPSIFEWTINAVPYSESNAWKPTAHMWFDTTKLTANQLAIVEDALYGDADSGPFLGKPSQIAALI